MTFPHIDVALDDTPNGRLLLKHTSVGVGGEDIPPTIRWDPWAEAASYAITCYDPDAPTGSGIWHLILTDIPADIRTLAPGDDVAARPHLNDLGFAGYTGAAPPPGPPHRYEFTVWALDVASLPVPGDATNAVCRFFIHTHAIAAGTRTVLYGIPR